MDDDLIKERVQAQFGAAAQSYVTAFSFACARDRLEGSFASSLSSSTNRAIRIERVLGGLGFDPARGDGLCGR